MAQSGDFDETHGRPFNWLVTLRRSRGIDRLRNLATRARVTEASAKEPVVEISDATSDAFRSEQRGLVTNALSQLPTSSNDRSCLPISTV